MGKAEPASTAKSTELKRRMEETFDIQGFSSFGGLQEYLKNLGQHSTAFALEQLLKEEEANIKPISNRIKKID